MMFLHSSTKIEGIGSNSYYSKLLEVLLRNLLPWWLHLATKNNKQKRKLFRDHKGPELRKQSKHGYSL